MQDVLRKLEEQPVGLTNLRHILHRKHVKVMLYDQLPEKGTLEQVFGKAKALVLFYMLHSKSGASRNETGHFSCILKLGRGKYEYFSSYGFSPEKELALSHSKGKLLRLLGKNYIQNTIKFQDRFHSATCGRWIAARCLLREVPLQIFQKYFRAKVKIKTADDLVTLMTMFLFR